ncbi:MAG: VOC family protein [Pseudomonadota bacterium]
MYLSKISLVIDDYDEAIAWFTEKLGFALIEDTALSADKRWVVVAPPGTDGEGAYVGGCALLLARASGEAQAARIGDQTGGRVFLFLETDDFDRDHAAFMAAGVEFVEPPRTEPYGKVAVFRDRWGNKWDLVERHKR